MIWNSNTNISLNFYIIYDRIKYYKLQLSSSILEKYKYKGCEGILSTLNCHYIYIYILFENIVYTHKLGLMYIEKPKYSILMKAKTLMEYNKWELLISL